MAPTDSSSDQPLGLTVHSMPAPQDIAANAAHTRMGVDKAPKAKRDMERLLRASAFWDTPGR